jgi:hypothetical protein
MMAQQFRRGAAAKAASANDAEYHLAITGHIQRLLIPDSVNRL